jgi:hypothetical protein
MESMEERQEVQKYHNQPVGLCLAITYKECNKYHKRPVGLCVAITYKDVQKYHKRPVGLCLAITYKEEQTCWFMSSYYLQRSAKIS